MGAERHRQETQCKQAEAWRLRLQGWTQQRIAETLGCTQQAVSKMLRKVEIRLFAEFVEEAAEIRARQTAQLEYLYERATQEFERSCQEAVRVSTVTGRTRPTGGEGVVDMPDAVTTVRETQCGNPALLAQAMKALADIRSIWGLNATTKTQITGPSGGPVRVVEVEIAREQLGARLARLAEAHEGDANGDG